MKNTRTFLLAFAATLLAGPAFPQTLSNPLADEGTKQRYHFLATYQDSPGQCLILGQNLGWSFEQFGPTVETLHDVTGQWPGLIGGQLRQAPGEIDLEALKLLYKNWQQAGGLVEMSMLPDNPWTGGSAWDISQTNIQQLTTPGQPGYTQWTAELDFYADVLSQMQDLGITVIWRPLVEMNGDWFWYGFHGSNDPQPYIDLYRNMYDYFTHTWHLNNLIWVYAANVSYSGIQSVGHFYPGSDVVDIVGLD
ncbi:MAG: glycoside hydrolase family 26 protein, partial [Saprospiraceae bacterium]|nr:glycoside hydrolase family 26 protein [Saprospiraceae bacterium]